MKHACFALSLLMIASMATAADLPAVPEKSIAEKKELLFSDDFESAEPAKPWHRVVPTFAFDNGALKGTQTRDKTVPAADGKPAVTAHRGRAWLGDPDAEQRRRSAHPLGGCLDGGRRVRRSQIHRLPLRSHLPAPKCD